MSTLIEQFEALLAQMAPAIRRAFLDAVQDVVDNAILAQVVDAIKRNDVQAAFDALGYTPPAFNPMTLALTNAFQQGGLMMMATFPKYTTGLSGMKSPLRFDIRDERTEKWLSERSAALVTGIEDDIRQTVRDTMVRGMQEGRNPNNVALDIVGRFNPQTRQREGGVVGLGSREEGWAASARAKLLSLDESYFELGLRDKRFDKTVRAAIDAGKPLPLETVDKLVNQYRSSALRFRGEGIGRTEALAALNRSEFEATQQALAQSALPDSAAEKVWETAGDNRVRQTHREMDGQTVGLNEAFTTPEGSKMMHPGDGSLGADAAEIVGCRCHVRYKIDFFAGVS